MKNFWFISMCAWVVLATVHGWSLPFCIVVILNAAVVLLGLGKRVRGWFHGADAKAEN